MNVQLLYESNDQKPAKMCHEDELVQDLNLHFVFQAMARNYPFLYSTAQAVILGALTDCETIRYRQDVIKDCLQNPPAIHGVFDIASGTLNEAIRYREYNQPNYARVVPSSVRVCVIDSLHILRGKKTSV